MGRKYLLLMYKVTTMTILHTLFALSSLKKPSYGENKILNNPQLG